ncbi:MAG: hypothetical protein JNM41_03325 [Flavipsychrobacter sp.]|nr:hypothetical protein [Flavipsychrobacter sp.]
MQPVKISISGDYIDCQIYRGRLYLWTFDGTVKVYNWDEMINSLSDNISDAVTLKFCFLDGNALYRTDLKGLFKDPDYKNILIQKIESTAEQVYTLTEEAADEFLYGQQGTPGNELPTDTEIYSNTLYYINDNGLFYSTAHRDNTKYPISSKPVKLWDCNLLSIKANKYPQLALSGGSEGLFEYNLSSESMNRWRPKEPNLISHKHSSFANYTFWSIYNTSLVDGSYMALFDLHEIDDNAEGDLMIQSTFSSSRRNRKSRFKREFRREINENAIFNNNDRSQHLSWGVDDKIYRAVDNGFEIVKFKNSPDTDQGESYFTRLRQVDLHPWKGKVIGGGTSYYGTIVECENALVVLLSNGASVTIEGPITRWRIYPRSLNYQNHLHVIKDDRIEIYSFNQDYFLQQNQKVIGLEYKPPSDWSRRFSDSR